MDDLDFSNLAPPQPSPAPASPPAPTQAPRIVGAEIQPYDAKAAMNFFRLAGEQENFSAGQRIFAEQEKPRGFFAKGSRVFLLLEGEVTLTLNGKPIDLIMPGEFFGELSLILDAPRTATATARKNCVVLALDEKRLLDSLRQAPEFALMLVGVMAQRLRRSVERLLGGRGGPLPPRAGGRGLDDKMLAELRHAMGDPAPTPMKAGDAIVTKGAVGASMFVVTAGQVSIAVDGHVVERVGPGEIFGETALLGPAARAATATAEADGAWLPVARKDFLALIKAKPAAGLALLRSMSERICHMTSLLGG